MNGKQPDQIENAQGPSDDGSERAETPGDEGRINATEQASDSSSETSDAKKHWEQLLRTTADFENFKKRAARERQDAVKFANESLLQKLIPILDHFDMALAATNQEPTAQNVQALQTGVAMTYQQLKKALTEAGLTEIDATGQPFDPNVHEAVSQQESSEVPEGTVLQQMRKGYKLRDRLLRPAMVVVAKPPSA